MTNELGKMLVPISNSTGLDIDIYTPTGSLIFSTLEEKPEYKFVYHDIGQFSNGVILDKKSDISYFLIKAKGSNYVGVITGSNEVSFNYAVMVGKIAEGALNSAATNKEKKSTLGQYLSGELNAQQCEELRTEFIGRRFNYYALTLIVNEPQKLDELKSFLETMAQGIDIVAQTNEKTIALFKESEGGLDYSSANDFAYILLESIKEEIRLSFKICVGGVATSFEQMAEAYQKSLFAHSFGTLFDPNSSVYSYKEYLMIKMLSDVPKESLEKYFDTLLEPSCRSILQDEELMNTAEEFMKNSLNIAETSRLMFMHRNTLIYRLDKIEATTGLNLRHFNDALILRLITIINRLINS